MLSLLLAGAIASSSVTARITSRQNDASATCSSSDGNYQLSSVDGPTLAGTNPDGLDKWEFTIKENSGKKQKVNGFGAAVTDSTVTSINSLPDDVRSEVLKDLMTSSGINLNLMRHTVASSDLTGDPAYTYDDNDGKADPDLASFGLGDRGQDMVSMLAEMKKLQSDMTLLGSPWAPPGWMQLDGILTGGTENNNLNHDYADAYAQYFVKYLQAYEDSGVHVDAITIQNEPLNSRAEMPTLYIDKDESAGLIRDNVGPALKEAGLKTQIWAFDHNTEDHDYPETVATDAADFISAAAWHCYSGVEPSFWTPMTDFHDQFPDLEQYMTECYTQRGTTGWDQTSNYNIYPLQNWANGIIAWALSTWHDGGPALSGGDACSGCTGLVTVNEGEGTYNKEIDYYMMGQYSKFIPKGATILDGTGTYRYDDGTGVMSVASLNPNGERTVVIQNEYDHDMWVTVGTESEDQPWTGRVVGKSVTTWVLPSA